VVGAVLLEFFGNVFVARLNLIGATPSINCFIAFAKFQ